MVDDFELEARIDLNMAVRLGQLFFHGLDIVNRALFTLGLTLVEHVQRLRAPLVDLVLRGNKRPDLAIPIVLTIDVSRLQEHRAPAHPLFILERHRPAIELPALGEVAPVPLPLVQIVHLHDLDALPGLAAGPALPLRTIIKGLAGILVHRGLNGFLRLGVFL